MPVAYSAETTTAAAVVVVVAAALDVAGRPERASPERFWSVCAAGRRGRSDARHADVRA